MGDYTVTIHGIDLVGLVKVIGSINRRYIKLTLSNIEPVIKNKKLSDSEKYSLVRKYVLDGYNEMSRNIMRSIFDYDPDE